MHHLPITLLQTYKNEFLISADKSGAINVSFFTPDLKLVCLDRMTFPGKILNVIAASQNKNVRISETEPDEPSVMDQLFGEPDSVPENPDLDSDDSENEMEIEPLLNSNTSQPATGPIPAPDPIADATTLLERLTMADSQPNEALNFANQLTGLLNQSQAGQNPLFGPFSLGINSNNTGNNNVPTQSTETSKQEWKNKVQKVKNYEHVLIISENSTTRFRYTFPRKATNLNSYINLCIFRNHLQTVFQPEINPMSLNKNPQDRKFLMPKGIELFLSLLPEITENQYKYEHGLVTSGQHLQFTRFLRNLVVLAVYLDNDASLETSKGPSGKNCEEAPTKLPRKYLYNENESICPNIYNLFHNMKSLNQITEILKKSEIDNGYDELLIDWFQTSPDDWVLKKKSEFELDSLDPSETKIEDSETTLIDLEESSGTQSKKSRKSKPKKSKEIVWAVGSGRHGQLTDSGRKCNIPTKNKQLQEAATIVCGLNCTFSIDKDGQVRAAGDGTFGRLGLGHSDDINVMTAITSLQGYVIRFIASSVGGNGHTIAISDSGEGLSWGDGDHGKLGQGTYDRSVRPKIIESLSREVLVKAACGWRHTLFLTKQGRVFACGNNENGRLGIGDTERRSLPALIEKLENIEIGDIACGCDHSLLLSKDGGFVWAFGKGEFGKLGQGENMSDLHEPTMIEALCGVGIDSIYATNNCSFAVLKNGRVMSRVNNGMEL